MKELMMSFNDFQLFLALLTLKLGIFGESESPFIKLTDVTP